MPSNGGEVGEDIVPGDQVVLGLHHLGVEVLGDVAAVLLAPVHHVGLVENVQLAVGYHLVKDNLVSNSLGHEKGGPNGWCKKIDSKDH